jgi:hypothetical protein
MDAPVAPAAPSAAAPAAAPVPSRKGLWATVVGVGALLAVALAAWLLLR